MEQEEHTRIVDLVTAADIALVTTIGADGQLHSRPLAVLQDDFSDRVWFIVERTTEKAAEIAAHPRVNVSFASGSGYLSLAGTARILSDDALIDQLWNPALEAWFEGGRDNPDLAVLEVTGDTAEYWAKTESGVFSLMKAVKALVTGEQPDIGENRTVDFP
ncbi:MAG: pyridoxamine 5'-phosphate oxidase family protein [Actinomycetota bacterium]|nr:pyridoxamine 5'-phosphate oxidase family protein [Actinomycetota bacterium]